jgi:uncharacterized iron-regulated membrane protein
MASTALPEARVEAPPGPPTIDPLPPPEGPPRDRRWRWSAPSRRFHLLAGLFISPFLVVVAVTGLLYVFTPQLAGLLYEPMTTVTPTGVPRASLAEQVELVQAAYPGAQVAAVDPPAAPDRATAVELDDPALPDGGNQFDRKTRRVFVDPYRNVITGNLVMSGANTPFAQWLRDLHGNLHLGEPGRIYSELAASWLLFLTITGLVVWLPPRVRSGWRRAVVPELRVRGRRRLRSVHAVVGLGLSLGLIGISLTGMTWSRFAGENFQQLVRSAGGSSPSLTPVPLVPPDRGRQAGLDAVARLAAGQRLRGDVSITPPDGPRGAYLITSTRKRWPVEKTTLAVDPYREQVTQRLEFAQFPLLAKLTSWGIYLHQGDLFGLPNQLALVALALGVLTMVGLGYRMWWLRRGARGLAAPRRTPLTGTQRALLVVAAIALAYAMPVFGVTLLAAVVVDQVAGRLRSRRTLVTAG